MAPPKTGFAAKPPEAINKFSVVLLVLCVVSFVGANLPPEGAEKVVKNCSLATDNFLGNAQAKFSMGQWVSRGLCIRSGLGAWGDVNTYECYARLENILEHNLNDVRVAEYAGAAGVLALLPTIGALLGTPTNEIWRLLVMIPFGGFLAMACSFGGAILPVKIKDYESDFMKKNIKDRMHRWTSSNLALPTTLDQNDRDKIENRAEVLMDRVQTRLSRHTRAKVPKMYILVGLTGMLLLLLGAQTAMIIVELGAVLPWWCDSKWWVHLWYLMVIVSAAVDNYVQLPFAEQWKLCLSDVPYDISVDEDTGDSITKSADSNDKEVDAVRKNLKQLRTLKTGTMRFLRRPQGLAEPRNVLFVLVSVADHSHNWRNTFIRSFSKITSIAVYVVGTASFASAQLLSISMATFVLTCVLGAGVFGRAITSWIVTGIETSEPMVHYVADNNSEAHYVLTRLFNVQPSATSHGHIRKIQVELGGEVFLDCKRVATRPIWSMALLSGILASPIDLARFADGRKYDKEDVELDPVGTPDQRPTDTSPFMKPELQHRSTFGSGTSSFSGLAITSQQTSLGAMQDRRI